MQNKPSPSETLSFRIVNVGAEDIHHGGVGLISNPIVRALSRTTQRCWRIWDGRVTQEMHALRHRLARRAESGALG